MIAHKKKGKIIGFKAQFLSGIAELTIEKRILLFIKKTKKIPCENPTTTRTLEQAFGNLTNTKNKEIEYFVDELGILKSFQPTGE